MIFQPMIRDWARRLIASERVAEPCDARIEIAAIRVYEKLRWELRAPVGADGFNALASRALTMAQLHTSGLTAVQVLPDGGLQGLGQGDTASYEDEQNEVGIVLIAHLLGLLSTLIGEATMVQLIEGLSLSGELNASPNEKNEQAAASGTNYFGPFRNIEAEANQLREVSGRLENLADTRVDVAELVSVAANIRGIAAILDVFTLIRSKAGGSRDSVLLPPPNDYLN